LKSWWSVKPLELGEVESFTLVGYSLSVWLVSTYRVQEEWMRVWFKLKNSCTYFFQE
jgi:hypothetical protein